MNALEQNDDEMLFSKGYVYFNPSLDENFFQSHGGMNIFWNNFHRKS
jgi:hypothetical protein